MAFVDSPDIVNVEGYTEHTVPVEPTTSWGELNTTSVVCVHLLIICSSHRALFVLYVRIYSQHLCIMYVL